MLSRSMQAMQQYSSHVQVQPMPIISNAFNILLPTIGILHNCSLHFDLLLLLTDLNMMILLRFYLLILISFYFVKISYFNNIDLITVH